MLDIDYSLWNAGAATGRHGGGDHFTADGSPPHERLIHGCG
jgi:hypothetical protein